MCECVWGEEERKGEFGFVCGFNLHSDVLTTNCIIGKHLLINDSEKTRQITIVYVCMGLFRPKHQLNVRKQGSDSSQNQNLLLYNTILNRIRTRGSMSHLAIRTLWEWKID